MRDRPRVLIVVTLAETGGAQAYVRDLVPGLVDAFDVTVAAHGPGPLGEAVSERGATFVPLRDVRRPISPLRDLLGIVELWRLCRKVRPRLIHTNSSKAGILGRVAAVLAGVRVRVFTAHGWAFKASAGRTSWLYLWADRAMVPITTAVVCVSETERAAGIAARTCRPDSTVTIFNGVELGEVARHPERDRCRIVSVGRLAEPKDFETLVRAAARLDAATAEVEVLGNGPQREELETLAARLGVDDRLRFLGEVADVRERLLDADLFVLSSLSEGLPISVLEAMAAGLPVVATSVGGLPELVDDGVSGVLVPPGDAEALASALAELGADSSRRRRMGEAARARAVARFSIEQCRAEHVALYERLLSSPRGGA